MLLFKYFLLIVIFIAALAFRKKMMEHTLGAIHRGALTLNNRVESWMKRQIETNPYSPYARIAARTRFEKMRAWRNIYKNWSGKKRSGDVNSSTSGEPLNNELPSDAGSGGGADGAPARARRIPVIFRRKPSREHAEELFPREIAVRAETGPAEAGRPEFSGETGSVAFPAGASSQEGFPVGGVELLPLKARESFGWQPCSDDGSDDGAVYGPKGNDVPEEIKKPRQYFVPNAPGERPGIVPVYGAWETTKRGPALRAYDIISNTPASTAYQVFRNKRGEVFARKIEQERVPHAETGLPEAEHGMPSHVEAEFSSPKRRSPAYPDENAVSGGLQEAADTDISPVKAAAREAASGDSLRGISQPTPQQTFQQTLQTTHQPTLQPAPGRAASQPMPQPTPQPTPLSGTGRSEKRRPAEYPAANISTGGARLSGGWEAAPSENFSGIPVKRTENAESAVISGNAVQQQGTAVPVSAGRPLTVPGAHPAQVPGTDRAAGTPEVAADRTDRWGGSPPETASRSSAQRPSSPLDLDLPAHGSVVKRRPLPRKYPPGS